MNTYLKFWICDQRWGPLSFVVGVINHRCFPFATTNGFTLGVIYLWGFPFPIFFFIPIS